MHLSDVFSQHLKTMTVKCTSWVLAVDGFVGIYQLWMLGQAMLVKAIAIPTTGLKTVFSVFR